MDCAFGVESKTLCQIIGLNNFPLFSNGLMFYIKVYHPFLAYFCLRYEVQIEIHFFAYEYPIVAA